MFCANCRKELQKEWKACPYCLTQVAKIQQEPPQSELLTDNELDNILEKTQPIPSPAHVAKTYFTTPVELPQKEKHKKRVLTTVTLLLLLIILLIVVSNIEDANTYTYDINTDVVYDSESDFEVDWDTNVNGGAIITKYAGSKWDVRIPPIIEGYPVTGIGDRAFQYWTITSVNIPDSVTSIGNDAFSGCTSLTSVNIPDSVTSIGWSAFSSCTSLTAINVGSGNRAYISDNGVLYNKSKTTLIEYPSGKTGDFTIPDSVTSIGGSAFEGCTSLTSVNIPDSVTSIGWSAFSSCSSLTAINVGFGNSAYTSLNGVLYNKNKTLLCTYPAGKKFKSFTIPNSVTSIESSAFFGCRSLTSITIPNSVTSIGGWAFEKCTSLTSVTFQGTIASNQFNDYAFPKLGDLRDKFYAANRTNGTPGTYTRANGESETWTRR